MLIRAIPLASYSYALRFRNLVAISVKADSLLPVVPGSRSKGSRLTWVEQKLCPELCAAKKCTKHNTMIMIMIIVIIIITISCYDIITLNSQSPRSIQGTVALFQALGHLGWRRLPSLARGLFPQTVSNP